MAPLWRIACKNYGAYSTLSSQVFSGIESTSSQPFASKSWEAATLTPPVSIERCQSTWLPNCANSWKCIFWEGPRSSWKNSVSFLKEMNSSSAAKWLISNSISIVGMFRIARSLSQVLHKGLIRPPRICFTPLSLSSEKYAYTQFCSISIMLQQKVVWKDLDTQT